MHTASVPKREPTKADVPLYGETIGQRITAAMLRAGLRKAHLAELVGVSWTSVNAWTKGRVQRIEAEHLIRIAQVTGVSAEWIQTGQGPALERTPPPAVLSFLEKHDVIEEDAELLREMDWGRIEPNEGMVADVWKHLQFQRMQKH